LRVPVQADQGEFRMGVEQRSGVATEAYCGVQQHGRSVRQWGAEQLQAPVQ